MKIINIGYISIYHTDNIYFMLVVTIYLFFFFWIFTKYILNILSMITAFNTSSKTYSSFSMDIVYIIYIYIYIHIS